MAYSRQQRASALRIVAEQGYQIAAGLTGISETSLRKWAAEAADRQRITLRSWCSTCGWEIEGKRHLSDPGNGSVGWSHRKHLLPCPSCGRKKES